MEEILYIEPVVVDGETLRAQAGYADSHSAVFAKIAARMALEEQPPKPAQRASVFHTNELLHHAISDYTVELQRELQDLVDDLTVAVGESVTAEKESLAEAERIGGIKGATELADHYHRRYNGVVIGLTALHVVQSLGRGAVIHRKADLDRLPVQGEAADISYTPGRQAEVREVQRDKGASLER